MTRSGLRLCSRSTLANTCTVVVGLALGPALAQMTWTRGEPARKFDRRDVGAGMGTVRPGKVACSSGWDSRLGNR
jgi:hypothetical protein